MYTVLIWTNHRMIQQDILNQKVFNLAQPDGKRVWIPHRKLTEYKVLDIDEIDCSPSLGEQITVLAAAVVLIVTVPNTTFDCNVVVAVAGVPIGQQKHTFMIARAIS